MSISPLVSFFSKYKYHFLVWSIFIAYEITLVWLSGYELHPYKEYVFAYTTGIFFFYFHAHVLLKYSLNTNKKLFKYSLPLLILLEVIGYITIKFLSERYIYKYIGIQSPEITKSVQVYMSSKLWRCIYLIGNSTGYYFLMHDLQQRKQVERMKQQELKKILREKEIRNELTLTQNAFLRAQINPHFLINTLSYLYNETRKQAPKAADSILSLSDIMQYALSKDLSSRYVKLENEIKLVESFLLLHQARHTYTIQLKLSYNKEVLFVPFIPLILMSLTENMIKHGQLDNPLKPAQISIVYENSVLSIETSNPEAAAHRMSGHDPSLKNISGRLSLAYGERASFNSHVDPQSYFRTYTKVQF